MCIRRHRIDLLWSLWELRMGEFGDGDAWPPEEVGHCND